MPLNELDYEELTKTLTDNFNILADEVQLLSDRKTILEHKLRFAHEQYQRLADKYAPGDAEISSTLAKLQLPHDPYTSDRSGFVPLPPRGHSQSKHQTAIAIRDGRRAAQRLSLVHGDPTGSTTSLKSISGSSLKYSAHRTSLSTVLEQDFTVPGRKGYLHCPFSVPATTTEVKMTQASQDSDTQDSDRPVTPLDGKDMAPHGSGDPICAAMYNDTASAPPSVTGSGAKCPIRYLDQHSPEEVAAYFETHKHEIPRSHEVCVRRYQRNENDIRKLDAKYGNLVNMIQGLGQKHQPMLPSKEEEEDSIDVDRTSNDRVEDWAHAVSADGVDFDQEEEAIPEPDEEDRESRFDRPLKEVRVGESPSRPWGISVPIFDPPERPISPPPAPFSVEHLPKPAGKCPFGHGQSLDPEQHPDFSKTGEASQGLGPFGHGQPFKIEEKPLLPPIQEQPARKCPFGHGATSSEEKETVPKTQSPPTMQEQPTFIQPADLGKMGGSVPQMIFTGPVFIGYPMEQALAVLQQLKGMSP